MMKKLSHCCHFWEPACKFQTPFLLQFFWKARCPGNVFPMSFIFQYSRDSVSRAADAAGTAPTPPAKLSIPGCWRAGWTTRLPSAHGAVLKPRGSSVHHIKDKRPRKHLLISHNSSCRVNWRRAGWCWQGLGARNPSSAGQGCGRPSQTSLVGMRALPKYREMPPASRHRGAGRPTAVSPSGWLGAAGCGCLEAQPQQADARDCLFPFHLGSSPRLPPPLFCSQALVIPLPEDFRLPLKLKRVSIFLLVRCSERGREGIPPAQWLRRRNGAWAAPSRPSHAT